MHTILILYDQRYIVLQSELSDLHGFKNDARERNLKREREEERSLIWKLL